MVFPEPSPIAVSPSKTEAPSKNYGSLFLETCAGCHGADGSARSPSGQKMFGRNLTDAKWQARRTNADLVRSILEGKGNMPSFKDDLSEADAQALVLEVIRPLTVQPKTPRP